MESTNSIKEITEKYGLKKLTAINRSESNYYVVDENGNLTALSISKKELAEFPIFETIKWLELNYCNLTSIPESIDTLVSLECLSLAGNSLKSIPASLGRLSALKRLNLSFNQIKSLPESLGDLHSLTVLNLENNHLTSLPDSFNKLKLDLLLLDDNNFR